MIAAIKASTNFETLFTLSQSMFVARST
jgi:hypothetical protein